MGRTALFVRGSTGLALLLLVACGWNRSLEFTSPTGGARIEIYQPFIDPMLGLKVDLVNGGKTSTLLEAGETYIAFAHVRWPAEGSVLGLLICGTREVRMAFDTRSQQAVSFDQVREGMDIDIRARYGEDPDHRVPTTCTGSYYQDQFRKRFPALRH